MKTLLIVTISILALIGLISAINYAHADVRTNLPQFKYLDLPKNYTLAQDASNNVAIRTLFHFPAGEEEVDTFKLFTTSGTGFDRNRGVLPIQLQGLISNDKPLLYKSIDSAFEFGTSKHIQNDVKIFDLDVAFMRGDQVYRDFAYENCKVTNYNIDTLFDKEETYMGKTKFAYVDIIDFQCEGLQILNPTYDKLKQEQKAEATANALANMKK